MSFISVLKEYRKGALLAALDEELLIVASEVEEKGKSGSLTLTIADSPSRMSSPESETFSFFSSPLVLA